MDIERVKEMEAYLDETIAGTEALTAALEALDGRLEQTKKLFDYYGSDDWSRDCEEPLPEGLKAGVLSEDLCYEAYQDLRAAAIRMLEVATVLLRDVV